MNMCALLTLRCHRNAIAALLISMGVVGSTLVLHGCGGSTAAALSVSISPASGSVGTLVTFTGADFSTVQSVKIGGVDALSISASTTTLVAMVMPGAATGAVSGTTSSATFSASNFTVTATGVPATQQGSKLVGTGAVGAARQGLQVALSADGNTAIVGGFTDNSNKGAAWIFIRSSGVWTQQGSKLVGTGAVGNALQGQAVAISADGNTVLIGGNPDNSNAGATWVFTRADGVWSQEGSKLVGTGAVGPARQGVSVSLSADGNTALIGGYNDNSNIGASWVFTRSAGVWTQQGAKLVGTGAVGAAYQGVLVALSADGNTALHSGTSDNSSAGAAWVFTRSSGVWSQQGSKLVGTGAVGAAGQGSGLAVSADGNTALIAGMQDNTNVGASWFFTRSSGVWSQQGSKVVGSGAVGGSTQGAAALSADGNTALVGGQSDNLAVGALWVFTRAAGVWSQSGSKLIGTGAVGAASQGGSTALSADGKTAISSGYADNSNAGASWVFIP